MAVWTPDNLGPKNLSQSLTLRFSSLLFLFLALSGAAYIAVSSAVSAKEYDSAVVNLAGRQRMLTQKYAREVNQVLVSLAASDGKLAESMKKAASRTAELYEETLAAFLEGGNVDAGKAERIWIPPVQGDYILRHLRHVKSEWEKLSKTASRAMRSEKPSLSGSDHARSIGAQTAIAVAEMDHVVLLLQQQSETKLRRVDAYMAVAGILNVVLFVGTVAFVRTRIVVPLDHLVAVLKTEIAERRQAENELRKLSIAVEQSPATVVITDTNGTIEYVNPRFTETTGYTREEAIGRNPRILQSGNWPKKAYEGLWETILAGRTWRGEFENRRKNGELYWESASISPVRNAQGEVTHFLAVKEDITERKQQEEELRRAKVAAEAANRAKSEFLANMSHELRTPMTAILGFAENMLDADQSASETLNTIQTIRRNGQDLLGIINDILDLAKIEAGKMTTERRACQPCSIIAEVASLMRMRADTRGLAFNIEYIGAIPEFIQSDPTRLRQILINLIGNAIKFTEAGTIRLVTRLVPGERKDPLCHREHKDSLCNGERKDSLCNGDDKENLCVPHCKKEDLCPSVLQFDVIDTGRGMTEEQQAKLFQPFMQGDTSTARKFGGTGLGLTISKRFAELLGGDVTAVQTATGVGSTFRIIVPTGSLDGVKMLEDPMSATVVADDAVALATRSDLRDCHILLAEDGPDNQRLISFILEKAGAHVTIVENGKLALDAALAAMNRRREGDPERPFDIILMDMQMPVLDGYEATGQLRQEGYTGPIIALTAHAMASDREKCIKAGCDDYATKPIDRAKLIETMRHHLQPAPVV